MALEDEMDEEINAAIDAPLLERRIADLDRHRAEEHAERANFRHAVAGALHVSGAAEGTLVDFVARLYARAAESEAQCARMRELLAMNGHEKVHHLMSDRCPTCAALSPTAGADLLREVTALRECERVLRESWGRTDLRDAALAAVEAARRKP